ncbi:F-box only protein 22-like [Mytilus edulis]|uniref:F-box only protein 22-like n=1 Tax=Mytilus edulis TaxID=6550 RepID=UPI0039EEBB36
MEECHVSEVLRLPVILYKILSFLPCKALNSCSRVCKVWSEYAATIKKKRKKIEWMSLECDEEEGLNSKTENLSAFIEQLSSEPDHVLMFCTSRLYETPVSLPSSHPTRFPRNAKCEAVEVTSFVEKLLPKICPMFALVADGVVVTDQKTNKTCEMEDRDALTLLSIPKIDGFDIYTFYVDIYMYANRMDESGSAIFEVDQVSTVPADKEVKAILFFCDEPFCPPEIGYTLLQHYKSCVIAGGYVDNFNSNRNSEASLMCIALCGPRVHAASVIIREEVNTAQEVDKIIKKLKDCNIPEENSFAFMFACIGRGKGHFKGSENVESSVFKKYFPKTPLFGFFGNGEVGFEHLNKYEENINTEKVSSEIPNKPLPKLYHAYTTIICLVSIN